MFCARCGARVSTQEKVCPGCALDLSLPGSVRLTDPALETTLTRPVLDESTPDHSEQGPSSPASGDDAPTAVMPGGPSEDDQATRVVHRIDDVAGPSSATAADAAPTQASQPWKAPGVPAGSQLPDSWFRDPQAERTAVLEADSGPTPTFTPPPPPGATADTDASRGPDPQERQRKRLAVVIGVLALTLVLLVVLVVVILGRSGGDGPKAVPAPAASSATPTQQTASASASSPEATPSESATPTPTPTPKPTPTPSPAVPLPAGVRSCGPKVGAGESTSCDFAANVAARVSAPLSGPATVDAYSPVTKKTYAMSCSPGDVVVCRGGNSAVVYVLP